MKMQTKTSLLVTLAAAAVGMIVPRAGLAQSLSDSPFQPATQAVPADSATSTFSPQPEQLQLLGSIKLLRDLLSDEFQDEKLTSRDRITKVRAVTNLAEQVERLYAAGKQYRQVRKWRGQEPSQSPFLIPDEDMVEVRKAFSQFWSAENEREEAQAMENVREIAQKLKQLLDKHWPQDLGVDTQQNPFAAIVGQPTPSQYDDLLGQPPAGQPRERADQQLFEPGVGATTPAGARPAATPATLQGPQVAASGNQQAKVQFIQRVSELRDLLPEMRRWLEGTSVRNRDNAVDALSRAIDRLYEAGVRLREQEPSFHSPFLISDADHAEMKSAFVVYQSADSPDERRNAIRQVQSLFNEVNEHFEKNLATYYRSLQPTPGTPFTQTLVPTRQIPRQYQRELTQAERALSDAKDDDTKEAARQQLGELLQRMFDEDLQRREQEVSQIEERVKNLREQLDRRREKRPEIIELQLKVIENEAAGLGFFSQFGSQPPDHQPFYQKMVWTCSMHPQIGNPESGKCPICGMDLVQVPRTVPITDPTPPGYYPSGAGATPIPAATPPTFPTLPTVPGGRFETRAGTNQARAQVGLLKSAVQRYRLDSKDYPNGLDELIQEPLDREMAKRWSGPYLSGDKLPLDPWGNEYHFAAPGKHNPDSFDVWSPGPDGQDGTADDIGNWVSVLDSQPQRAPR